MSGVEASRTAEARVCVPNELIGIAGWQERALFSNEVQDSMLDEARKRCVREAGSTACGLQYRDITALASELEEIGYVSCGKGLSGCDSRVSQVAVDITAGLKSRYP